MMPQAFLERDEDFAGLDLGRDRQLADLTRGWLQVNAWVCRGGHLGDTATILHQREWVLTRLIVPADQSPGHAPVSRSVSLRSAQSPDSMS